ncbi:MAG: preprotein translocase subunit SecA, partial [Verrucomicrobiota bacterium]
MLSLSPSLLTRACRDYEPWGLIRQAWAGGKGEASESAEEQLVRINELADTVSDLSDQKLQVIASKLRGFARSGAEPHEYLVESFALVREASRRVLGLFHYDVQLLGGLAICEGTIAEMATGEGKTLVQSLAAFTRSLPGNGVHVATANSYLAERDFEFAKPLFDFLGTSAELLPERVPSHQKRKAYAADVTYGTGTEFGFDYLRDQVELLKVPPAKPGVGYRREILGLPEQRGAMLCQRGLSFAIIDEIDSVLIDEAATPLVISGKAGDKNSHPEVYHLAKDVALSLEEDEHVTIDEKARSVKLSESGIEQIHRDELKIPWARLVRPWKIYIENALRAIHLFERDTDYLIDEEQKIVIVDSFTGRVREGSSWKEGLHQAVEAHELVEITAESSSVAGISRQRFYRLYDGLGGMTGTASESAGELWRFYQLSVRPVPRNRPSMAKACKTRIFRYSDEKFEAIARDACSRQQKGQPVLIGCRTIEESESLSEKLAAMTVPHTLLNAKTAGEEAEIVSNAGISGAITVAT